MYSLVYSDIALKQLEKMDNSARKRVISALERCRIRPYAHVKKLVGNSYFRLRVGDYRIILEIRNEQFVILVIKVGHRGNIYETI